MKGFAETVRRHAVAYGDNPIYRNMLDVGGIFASTQSISDADFLAGHYTFAGSGTDGSVLNLGTIRAADGGYVALAAGSVVNDGVIRAYKGTVALGAGDQITLSIDGNRLVGFSVDKAAVAALMERCVEPTRRQRRLGRDRSETRAR